VNERLDFTTDGKYTVRGSFEFYRANLENINFHNISDVSTRLHRCEVIGRTALGLEKGNGRTVLG
jgi:hypothetical protein